MIHQHNLRLGNYVKADGRIHIIRSTSDNQHDPIRLIDLDGGKMMVNGVGKIELLPITNILLDFCGFLKGSILTPDGQHELFVRLIPATAGQYSVNFDGHWIAKIQYLHELQNIHHALTGEELKIKPR